MGRKPIGALPMTSAERQRRSRALRSGAVTGELLLDVRRLRGVLAHLRAGNHDVAWMVDELELVAVSLETAHEILG